MAQTPKQWFDEIKAIAAGTSLSREDQAAALLRGSARDFETHRETRKESFYGRVLEIAAMNYTATMVGHAIKLPGDR